MPSCGLRSGRWSASTARTGDALTARTLLHVFPSFEAGGAQVRATRLWPALGGDLRHLVCALDGCWDAADLLPADFPLERVEAHGAGGSLRTARWALRLLSSNPPDALCTYNWGSMDVVLAARASGLHAHVHHEDGFGPDEAAGQKLRRVWARRWLLRRARAIVVPSQGLHALATRTWRLPEERVRLVRNGIDTAHFSPGESAALRAQLGVPEGALLVGCVGRLRREKNVPRLLAAAARAGDAHLLVIGDGEQRARIEALANESHLAGRVHLVGHQDQVLPWYRAMDALALSSDTEQMPMALLEGMATGLPVVSTDVGDVRAMLPPEQGGLVVPLGEGVEQGLAEALRRLATDATLRASLGAANRARVLSEYTFPGMVESYRSIYAEALGAA